MRADFETIRLFGASILGELVALALIALCALLDLCE